MPASPRVLEGVLMNEWIILATTRSGAPLELVTDILTIKAELELNTVSTVTLTLRSSSSQLKFFLVKDACFLVKFRGQLIFTGRPREITGEGASHIVSVLLEDDFRLLGGLLAWPMPQNRLDEQIRAYDVRRGKATSVFAAYVSANASRLGIPVRLVHKDEGENVSLGLRMHSIADKLVPVLDAQGFTITVTFDSQAQKYEIVCAKARAYGQVFSPALGVVSQWKVSRNAPGLTRVVVGGQGEGIERTFVGYKDMDRETQWGIVSEVFKDARDAKTVETLARRGKETLEGGAAKEGASITLSETPWFKFGTNDGPKLGDIATIELPGQVRITDRIRGARISSTERGTSIELDIGENPTVFGQITNTLRNIVRTQNNLGAGL